MERLTRRINDVVVYVGTNNPYTTGQIPCEVELAGVREMMDRLAAYEDTGLTPEDCAEYRKFEDEIIASGKTFGRLIELLKADKEGRVVVLPEVRYCERYGWQNITWDSKYGICAGSHDTREDAEEALRRAENGNC